MKAFYKNILVISDNPALCRRFHDVVQMHQFEADFTFATSPFSDPRQFKIDGDPLVVNLRNPEDVKKITEDYDLVFSMHCKQLFPDSLIEKVKCINIHPGYNPINRGWYPQVFAIIHKRPVGATIHEIDSEIDNGKIIARDFIEQFACDTSGDLYDRILDKEIELLEEFLPAILSNEYETISPEDQGNLYLKKDFNELLEIDLKQKMTAGELIDRLRALTHGNFKNAYFIDPETGKKIYVGIQLTREDE